VGIASFVDFQPPSNNKKDPAVQLVRPDGTMFTSIATISPAMLAAVFVASTASTTSAGADAKLTVYCCAIL
jgi:hypothetical protein